MGCYLDFVFGSALVACFISPSVSYSLEKSYEGDTFFDGFYFFSGWDSTTHGTVEYVESDEAFSSGLVKASEEGVYMGADSTEVTTEGRKSVRIGSNIKYSEGLFILDLEHMPEGCGTWPAFWLVGSDWPNEGEVDIIEGVNNQTNVVSALHTTSGCSMAGTDTSTMTGHYLSENCDISDPSQGSNQGCGIESADAASYGTGFNQQGGGVYAVEWLPDQHISIWFFHADLVPVDISNGTPDPSGWATASAYFQLGDNCDASHFGPQEIVFDLTFCGDWAGNTFESMCPGMGDCASYVQNNPSAFVDAYWSINSLKVYSASTATDNGTEGATL